MMENLYSAVPLIGLLVVALAVYAVWRINEEKQSGFIRGAKRGRVSFVLGILVCLISAFLMAFGEGLIGENHAGVATVIGIVGIGLIGTSGASLAALSTPVNREDG